ncbi:hypothetical protein LTR53_019478, partial [Teratosphaeriaceae sp. CCFEE 6253]
VEAGEKKLKGKDDDIKEQEDKFKTRTDELDILLVKQRRLLDAANVATTTAMATIAPPQLIEVPVAAPPKTLPEQWSNLPAWLRFLAVLLLSFLCAMVVCRLRDQHLWASTNDRMHQWTLSRPRYMYGSYGYGWTAWFADMLGGDVFLMGS